MQERLSAIDGSFLRVETPNAHMHVAWSAAFRVPAAGPRPTLERLRRSIAGRLEQLPRFRRRLAYPPPGMGEPFWVDDPDFDIARHVLALGMPNSEIDDRRFAFLCDGVLSAPLARDRPLWEVRLAPRLSGGRCGLVAKLHHALVDGKAAVEAALLLFDTDPDATPAIPRPWRPEPRPGAGRLAVEALAYGAEDSFRAARSAARFATAPVGGASRIAGTLRRAALAAGEDLLRPAPSSLLNQRIGPRRTLVRHSVRFDDVQRARGADGATLNDVCLAGVAGALRELAIAREERPRPLKAMVPVSVRGSAEAETLGNRITLAFVQLPLDEPSAQERLARVHTTTAAFKRANRPAGTEAVLGTLGLLPGSLRGPAARAVASPRVYNLTVSNVPGPPVPLYMLGAELLEAHPVVPLAERHALSVGIFTHLEKLHFGLYADPEAFPQVSDLPRALETALCELGSAASAGRLAEVDPPEAEARVAARRAEVVDR